jgi:hypothetical protein
VFIGSQCLLVLRTHLLSALERLHFHLLHLSSLNFLLLHIRTAALELDLFQYFFSLDHLKHILLQVSPIPSH